MTLKWRSLLAEVSFELTVDLHFDDVTANKELRFGS